MSRLNLGLHLSIGAYTSTEYHQAVLDAVDILKQEPLAVWLFEQNIPVVLQVNPRVSKRFPNSTSNPVFTADFSWQLADDVQTAVHLKFYPLPTPKSSVGVWTFA
jgi:hypothetical protein